MKSKLLFSFILFSFIVNAQISLKNVILKGDVLNEALDINTGEITSFTKTGSFFDGSLMDDKKVDGVIYVKYKREYYKRNYESGIKPEWFGAKKDGITDDTVAFQKAIDFLYLSPLSNLQSGGDILLSTGKYRVEGLFLKSGVSLVGQGAKSSFLISKSTVKPILMQFNSQDGEFKSSRIQKIGFDGGENSSGASRIGYGGILLDGMNNVLIENCNFQRFIYSGVYTTNNKLTVFAKITDCIFSLNTKFGIYLASGASTEIKIVNSMLNYNGIGLYAENNFKTLVEHSVFEKNDLSGAEIYGKSNMSALFFNCYFEDNGLGLATKNVTPNYINLYIDDGNAIDIINSYFTFNKVTSNDKVRTNIKINRAYNAINIENNIFNGGGEGIDIDCIRYDEKTIKVASNRHIGSFVKASDIAVKRLFGDFKGLGLIIKDSSWDKEHLILGEYNFWIDNNGDLRVKKGKPLNVNDGKIVNK